MSKISKFLAIFVINKIIFNTIKHCLLNKKGWGVPAGIFFDKSCHRILGGFIDFKSSKKYGIFIDETSETFYVTRFSIVVWQGIYPKDVDSIFSFVHESFLGNRVISTAFELAALGEWTSCEKYVDENYYAIVDKLPSCSIIIYYRGREYTFDEKVE